MIYQKAHKEHIEWLMGTTTEKIDEYKMTIKRTLSNPRTGRKNHRDFRIFFQNKNRDGFRKNDVETIFNYMFPLKEMLCM